MRAAFYIYADQKIADLWGRGRFFYPFEKQFFVFYFEILFIFLFTCHIQSFQLLFLLKYIQERPLHDLIM